MSDDLEKAQQAMEAAPGIVDLLFLGVAGIMELANVIKYDKCEIFIQNNHHHDIYVALDAYDKHLLKGWYKIEAYTKSSIYTTERRTWKVGIYAECSECDSNWGNQTEKYIPNDGDSFDIQDDDSYSYNDNYKKVKFSYSGDIRKRKEYTFNIG